MRKMGQNEFLPTKRMLGPGAGMGVVRISSAHAGLLKAGGERQEHPVSLQGIILQTGRGCCHVGH